MKLIQSVFKGLLGLAILGGSAFAAEDCARIGGEVGVAVKADSAQVLVLVEEALRKNEVCACEIVTAAIGAAKAGKNEELLKQIVITALTAAESQAATIAECAMAAAPEGASAVKEAMRVVYGESGDGSGPGKTVEGKEVVSGKELVSSEDEVELEDSWAGRPVSVGGVYLIAPVAPSASVVERVRVQDFPAADDADGDSGRRTTTPPPVSPPNGLALPLP